MPDDDIDIEVTLDRFDPFTLAKLKDLPSTKIVHTEFDYLGGNETTDVVFISFSPTVLPSILKILDGRAWPENSTKIKFEGYECLDYDAIDALILLKRRYL